MKINLLLLKLIKFLHKAMRRIQTFFGTGKYGCVMKSGRTYPRKKNCIATCANQQIALPKVIHTLHFFLDFIHQYFYKHSYHSNIQ